jgi:hypothetical protein
MKVQLIENDHGFFLSLAAESMTEAALLTRMGMKTKECETVPHTDGTFTTYVQVTNYKNTPYYVRHPRRYRNL